MTVLDAGLGAALILGLLLGLKHATDADHVVAVSTIAAEFGSAWRGIWVGVSWGLGHTTPLILVGLLVLVFKEALLEDFSTAAPLLEMGVGVMLIFLGGQVIWRLTRGQLHVHSHSHSGPSHLHIHASHEKGHEPVNPAVHSVLSIGKSRLRLKSFVVGIIHGLAGSAAIMIALLPQLESIWAGIAYLITFGIGTMISMALMTLLMGLPFALTARLRRFDQVVASVAGGASIFFGVGLLVTSYFDTPFHLL